MSDEPAGLSTAFFDEAATGTEADQATTNLRTVIQATIIAQQPDIPLDSPQPRDGILAP